MKLMYKQFKLDREISPKLSDRRRRISLHSSGEKERTDEEPRGRGGHIIYMYDNLVTLVYA